MSYFGTKVFKKIFIMYSFIIITILVLLSIFVTFIITNTVTNNERFINQKIEQNISDYFNHDDETSTALLKMLYSNSLELKDTINFLNYDSENYLKMRLDAFIGMNGQTYDSIDTFISQCFSYNRDVENVMFYSDKNDVLTIYYPVGNCTKIYDVRKKMNKNQSDNISNDILLNLVNSSLKLNDDKSYYTIKNLKTPNDFKNMGILMIRYNLNSIDTILKNYKKYNNTVLILDNEGKTIYDSLNKYTKKKYTFIEKIQSTDKPVLLDKYSYIDFSTNISGNTVISILPVDNIRAIARNPIIMYFVLAIILFIIAEAFIYFKVQNISLRIKNITNAMNRVQNGDFKAVICEDKEVDEITLITKSFNNMCKQLDDHIKKVYVSEIKQKNAEMVAFQSQINPHFLYNTLESIRMKAISEGNKEVGRMLYNLAFLFRNMVKGKSKISLAQEIAYSKMYLQLFKFRYNDKFDYSINMGQDIEENEIIKFTIQPVIENFLVHGINLDVEDNFITINAEKGNNVIKITIQDNGTGINDSKLDLINENIKSHKNINSIGLVNVNERIKYQYGDEFGLFVENGETKGTKVTITIPIKGVENDV